MVNDLETWYSHNGLMGAHLYFASAAGLFGAARGREIRGTAAAEEGIAPICLLFMSELRAPAISPNAHACVSRTIATWRAALARLPGRWGGRPGGKQLARRRGTRERRRSLRRSVGARRLRQRRATHRGRRNRKF